MLCVPKTFMEIGNVHLRRGVFDQMFGVGDIETEVVAIRDVTDYTKIYNLVETLQKDIQIIPFGGLLFSSQGALDKKRIPERDYFLSGAPD